MANKHKKQSVQKAGDSFVANNWEGAIPHPTELQAYEDMCPGATDRFIKLIETEQSNLYELNTKVVDTQKKLIDNQFRIHVFWQIIICMFVIGLLFYSYISVDFILQLITCITGVIGAIATFVKK